jgi:hypothetical protein
MLIFLFCSLKLLLADLVLVGTETGMDGDSESDRAASSSPRLIEALASRCLSSSTGNDTSLGLGEGGGGTSSLVLGMEPTCWLGTR